MDDFIINQSISTLLFFLQRTPSTKRAAWRRALLKVFRAIASAFPGDQDFIEAAQSVQKKG